MGPLFPRMHTAAFGDEVANGKPAPDIYLLAAQRLGIPAERCLALEDSLPGARRTEGHCGAGPSAIARRRPLCLRTALSVRDGLAA
jgi:hypothetical protein